MFFFSVEGKIYYVNTLLKCHFCIQMITHHFLLSKVSRHIQTIPRINAHLLYPILCTKYSTRHKLYCPVYILICFHGNQHCVASCHYLYAWGVLQEVDVISTVGPQYSYSLSSIITIFIWSPSIINIYILTLVVIVVISLLRTYISGPHQL